MTRIFMNLKDLTGKLLILLLFQGFAFGCSTSTTDSEAETEVFMWMGSNHILEEEPRMYDNILAFGKRHDIIPYESGANDTTSLRSFLERSRREGIEKTWIEIGPKREEITIREFVENPDSRTATLERFRTLARVYKSFYPDFARISIFDEAPLGAFATSVAQDTAGYTGTFSEFREFAPEAFSYLYKAIKEVYPSAEVGIFMHHPHNASPEMSGEYSYIETFMAETEDLGALPDFIYSDVYRGYFNRGYGVELTNRYIADVVRHTRQVADQYGVKAYQLGQVHTIKLGYTPSRLQIDTNIEAMLEGNPHGIGWYWPNYASTNYLRTGSDGIGTPTEVDVSFDPFIPNSWGKHGPAGSLYGTSRDRFTYSYLRILEAAGQLDPKNRFDLWVYGYDFDHTEHTLWLKETGMADQWTFIGHFNPQQDPAQYEEEARGKYMYSFNNRSHAVVFHGLERDRYVAGNDPPLNGTIEIKITTPGSSDGSHLSAIYAVPYRKTRHYTTEEEITRFIEEQPRWVNINSLVSHVRPVPFRLEETSEFTGKLVPMVPDSLLSNNTCE